MSNNDSEVENKQEDWVEQDKETLQIENLKIDDHPKQNIANGDVDLEIGSESSETPPLCASSPRKHSSESFDETEISGIPDGDIQKARYVPLSNRTLDDAEGDENIAQLSGNHKYAALSPVKEENFETKESINGKHSDDIPVDIESVILNKNESANNNTDMVAIAEPVITADPVVEDLEVEGAKTLSPLPHDSVTNNGCVELCGIICLILGGVFRIFALIILLALHYGFHIAHIVLNTLGRSIAGRVIYEPANPNRRADRVAADTANSSCVTIFCNCIFAILGNGMLCAGYICFALANACIHLAACFAFQSYSWIHERSEAFGDYLV